MKYIIIYVGLLQLVILQFKEHIDMAVTHKLLADHIQFIIL